MENRIMRFWKWKYLFIILLVIHVAPMWIFWYFPTQDGPSHIYNSKVLRDYHDPGNYQIRKAFNINAKLFPNWTSHALMMALMYIVPPMVAEKILLSIAIALVPLSLFYLLRAVDQKNALFSLLGFIYAYNNLLHMGFYNFALSVSVFLFTLGYWWKHREGIQLHHIAILNALLILTYFTHYASYMLLLATMGIIALFSFLSETARSLWTMRGTEFSISALLRKLLEPIKSLAIFAGYMLLTYMIGLEYYLRTRGSGKPMTMKWLKNFFWDMQVLVSYTDWHISVTHILLGLLFTAALATIIYRIWRRQWFLDRDVFLLLAIIFTIVFFNVPREESGGGWVNDRIYIYIFLFLAVWFVAFHKPLRYAFGIGLIVLSLTHLGRHCYEYSVLQTEIAEQASGIELIEPHSTLFVVRVRDNYSETLGDMIYVEPFLFAPCYYGLKAKDVAYYDNYEAGHPYFPIALATPQTEGFDYILAWNYPEDTQDLDIYKDNYDLVHSNKRLKLFRLKKQSDSDLDNPDKEKEREL